MSALAYPTPSSPLYAIACDYARAGNTRDYDLLDRVLADDFSYQIHPSSMRVTGPQRRLTKNEVIARTRQLLGEGGLTKSVNVSPNLVFVAAEIGGA